MPTICVIGEVVSIGMTDVQVKASDTLETYTLEVDAEQLEQIEVGKEGVFVGTLKGGAIKIKRVDIRRFLDPLYEEDVFETGSRYVTVPVPEDPFDEMFSRESP